MPDDGRNKICCKAKAQEEYRPCFFRQWEQNQACCIENSSKIKMFIDMLAGKVNFVLPFSKKNPQTQITSLGISLFYPQNFQPTPLSTKVLYIYTDRSSGSRIILLAAPSLPTFAGQWLSIAAFVPDHSGGLAPDLHGILY